ncbi:ead/Ea22-like family protein [Klebsiella pneumoniae]|nr:ead/Ea22-like family protein [Klebsiella pneumoniae]
MTTDITELAQSLKAAAEKATPGRIGDRIDGSGSIKYECHGYDGSLVLRTDHKNMEYGFIGDNSLADEEFFMACVPDAILALVEALEKAQQRIGKLEKKLTDHNRMNQEMAKAMLTPNDSDAAGMEIAALRQRIAALESRTVKLPDLRQIVSGDRYVWSDGVYNYSQDVKVALAAAGIKVEAE